MEALEFCNLDYTHKDRVPLGKRDHFLISIIFSPKTKKSFKHLGFDELWLRSMAKRHAVGHGDLVLALER